MLLASLITLLAISGTPAPPKFIVPNFRDLKIRVQRADAAMIPHVTTWYFKGPRERVEHNIGESPRAAFADILQCDQRTAVHLDERHKTYRVFDGLAKELSPSQHPAPEGASTGPEVTVTIETVDTGEVRSLGNYAAHHVKTTVSVVPEDGAATQAGKTEIDGWYIDLPGTGCEQDQGDIVGLGMFIGLKPRGDHVTIKHLGDAHRGFAIEEKSTQRTAGNVIIHKLETLEFSEKPLSEELFEILNDYTPAPYRRGVSVRMPKR